jgi:hypothetical protein
MFKILSTYLHNGTVSLATLQSESKCNSDFQKGEKKEVPDCPNGKQSFTKFWKAEVVKPLNYRMEKIFLKYTYHRLCPVGVHTSTLLCARTDLINPYSST